MNCLNLNLCMVLNQFNLPSGDPIEKPIPPFIALLQGVGILWDVFSRCVSQRPPDPPKYPGISAGGRSKKLTLVSQTCSSFVYVLLCINHRARHWTGCHTWTRLVFPGTRSGLMHMGYSCRTLNLQ